MQDSEEDYVVNVEYNYVHDFGAGITNDYGGIKTGVKASCDAVPEAEMEAACFSYIRVYNNLVRDGWPYFCCANFLYSDVSCSKNLFENNIVYGSADSALIHHCGLENESKNNYIHRVASPDNGLEPIANIWGLCEDGQGKHQSFHNHHNIYYFDNTEDMTMYKRNNFFDDRSVFSDNLYYSLDPEDEFKGMFPPSDLPFSEFPSEGSRWADPGFMYPEAHVYLLPEDSPALQMGIQQIRLDNFGIQADKRPFYL